MITVQKIADIIDNLVVLNRRGEATAGDIAAILTNLQPVSQLASTPGWQLDLTIGDGPGARVVRIDLPLLIGPGDARDQPKFLGTHESRLVWFDDRLFLCERPARSTDEVDEITLRVKKVVYEERSELLSLRASVANYEAAFEYQKGGPKREPIPEDVKLLVWTRDGGACTRCGERSKLHFDHIIPVAKGGGNSADNIQILCEPCNLRKSDKIASL